MGAFAAKQKPTQEAESSGSARRAQAFSRQGRDISLIRPLYNNEQAAQERLQAKRVDADGSRMVVAPPIVHEVLHSTGQLLDSPTRTFMESRFGHDFSHVRVHTDARAAEAASAIAAHAFTVNRDIVFGAGEYAPQSESGRRLLSHELTHVVQQQAGVHLKDGVGHAGDAYESHADSVADLVVNGKQAKPLLDRLPRSAGSRVEAQAGARVMLTAGQPVQMQPRAKQSPQFTVPQFFDHKKLEEWNLLHKIKQPIADKLAHDYVNRDYPQPKDLEPKDPDPKVSPKSKQTPYKYVWAPSGTAPVATPLAVTTYSGGNIPVPIQEPSEQRVALAIYRSLEKTKTGKGDKLTDWTWKDAPEGKKKTPDEKVTELALGAARLYVEDKTVGKIEEITIRWIARHILGASVAVASGAAVVIGVIELALDVMELLNSAAGPAELSAWQNEDARIVADVKAYLQNKEDAADYKKRLSGPLQIPIYNPVDNTGVVIPHY